MVIIKSLSQSSFLNNVKTLEHRKESNSSQNKKMVFLMTEMLNHNLVSKTLFLEFLSTWQDLNKRSEGHMTACAGRQPLCLEKWIFIFFSRKKSEMKCFLFECVYKKVILQAHILQFTHHFTIFYQKKKNIEFFFSSS